MSGPRAGGTPVSVIDRIALVVDAATKGADHVTPTTLPARTGLPRATTSRIANALVRHGFLERSAAGYGPGWRMGSGGRSAVEQNLAGLRRLTGRTTRLCVLDGPSAKCVAELLVGPSRPEPAGSPRLPLHATASGKLLLVFAAPGVLARVLAAGLPRTGPRAITDPDRLGRELVWTHTHRLARDRDESASVAACTAVPVFAGEEVVASLSISSAGSAADFALRAVALAVGRELLSRPVMSTRNVVQSCEALGLDAGATCAYMEFRLRSGRANWLGRN
jgi:DNA-binding IclR family transcriptional regulator